ncbi:facilitated trehalose transporter Tret1-like [Ostrinia furnacalis]|uniref:facilitated trehalose transporter Tret1-like n=1 Tax=Ostrinia furnacalis TaxID=93504 RepID=UPI00103AE7E8|nr:facilitated trehalose transporter Tret1-like [Ostrinia furnacalis]
MGFLAASTTLMTYGLQAGWISPMIKVLQSDDSPTGPLTDTQLSWVGSVLPLTGTFCVALYAYIADAYGRKFGVIAIAAPQAICWAIKLTATNPTILIIARVMAGIPAGGCFNLIPMYVKEISQDDIRGSVVSMSLLMQNFGLLFMYAMGSYLGYYTVLYIVIGIPIVTVVVMLFAPESPAFLVKRERFEEAAQTVARLRGLDVDSKIVKNEMDHMKNEEEKYRSLPTVTFLNIFKNKAWRRGFFLVMALLSTQSLNGNFTILTYAWTILSESGVTANPELTSLVVPVLMICGSIVSMMCVERFGRKKLLIATFSITVVAMITLATTQLLRSQGWIPPSWLPVIAIAASVWAYSAGVTPMVFVIMSEMFSFQVRAKLIGCLVTYAWFMSSTQVSVCTPIANAFGMYTLFYIFAAINVLGAVLTCAVIPETKGRSIEEIEQILTAK